MNPKLTRGTRITAAVPSKGHCQLTVHLPDLSGCDSFVHFFNESGNWRGNAWVSFIGIYADLSPSEAQQLAEFILAPIGGKPC